MLVRKKNNKINSFRFLALLFIRHRTVWLKKCLTSVILFQTVPIHRRGASRASPGKHDIREKKMGPRQRKGTVKINERG